MSESISREEPEIKLPSTTKRFRTHSVNQNYFKVWSPEMAYILGFTAADGCIRVNTEPVYKENGSIVSYRGIYQVTWSATDYDVLEFIKKELDASYEIRERPVKYYEKYGYTDVKPQWYITINSKEMVSDLALLGILPSKSKTIEFISYPKEYMQHFIRGVFDGDGCWALDIAHTRPHPRAFITSGSKSFLDGIGDFLRKELGIIPKIYKNKRDVFNLCYGGPEVAALAHYLNSGFMISRKREKMLETIKGYHHTTCSCGTTFIKIAGSDGKHCFKCKNLGT